MPRKRVAEAAPEPERPAKRQTRSSAKLTPLAEPAPLPPTTRRGRKRAAEDEHDEDSAQSSSKDGPEPPVKSRTRTKAKAQTNGDVSLVDETNLVRPSAGKPGPKPRKGRTVKETDVEEAADEEPPTSETAVSEPNDAPPPPVKVLRTYGKRNKKASQTLVRSRSPTMEVVIPKRQGRSKKEEPALMDVDTPALESSPPSPPKRKAGGRGKRSANTETAPSEATVIPATRATRSNREQHVEPVDVAEADVSVDEPVDGPNDKPAEEEVQTSRRPTRKPKAPAPAPPTRRSRRNAGEDPESLEEVDNTVNPPDTAEIRDAPDASENDYGSLFGEEQEADNVAGENAGEEQTNIPPSASSSSLPAPMQSIFTACRKAVVKKLTKSTLQVHSETSSNYAAIQELTDLIDGTVHRAEGNSCLVLGPRGCGKSTIIDSCLDKVASKKPIVLRLSGWVQTSDRHALREIAYQLLQQTGSSLLPDSVLNAPDEEAPENPENPDEDGGDENPFLERAPDEPIITLPPSAHLHSLIPVLLTLDRPVIVILDSFDLFALHPRQSLLYCLLDTVQSCRASSGSQGLAVIGVTTRVDTVQLLEKRVKSRFSGRTIRTAPPTTFDEYLAAVRDMLLPTGFVDDEDSEKQWNEKWQPKVEEFLNNKQTLDVLKETYSLTRNLKVISRMLISAVAKLTPIQPYLLPNHLVTSTTSQRARPSTLHLSDLSYPWLCLLIASAHSSTSGHDQFTFEMLYESFVKQIKNSASAPVELQGKSIAMQSCSRGILINAFEQMVAAKIFVCSVAPASTVSKEFMKYRCAVLYGDIKTIVGKSGQTTLKKWFSKSNEINQAS